MQTAKIEELIGMDPRDAVSAIPAELELGQMGDLARPAPLRFWEIDHVFKCPAIGTCLEIAEQRQILKSAGVSLKRKDSFQIQEALVATSENENKISRKVDLKLGRKFRDEIGRFFDVSEDEFMRLWKDRSKAGEYEGIFWVAAIRPDLSPEASKTIFGDIHMAMHLGARRQSQTRQAIVHQQEKNQELTLRLKEVNGTPSLHEAFKIDHSPGLKGLVRNGDDVSGQGTRVGPGNLYVLPCGGESSAPEAVFESSRFSAFLKAGKERFDYVILDVRPVLPFPDSRIIGAGVDGVILVLKSGSAREQVAVRAKKALEETGAKVIGVVLNRRKFYIPDWVYRRL